MLTTRAWSAGVVLVAALGAVVAPGCGGAGGNANSAVTGEDESKAERLLARARETRDPERYRQVLTRFGHTNAAGEAKDELAAILIEQAEAALKAQDFATAEDRAEEARVYAALDNTDKARAILDKIDDQRAARVSGEAAAQAKEGKCASALKHVAATLRKKPRERYKREVQKLSQEPLVECLSKKVDDEVKAGNNEAARQMLDTPDATTALSNDGYKKAQLALSKLVVGKSTAAIQPLLAEKKWTEAIAKLDELQQNRTISAEEHTLAFGLVQDAIHKALLELARQGLTAEQPGEIEAQLAKQIEIAKWKPVPEDLAAVRSKLGVVIQCEKLGCKWQKPAASWAWGAIEIRPADAADAAATGKLKHAQKAFVVAKSKSKVLVTLEEPVSVERAALLDKAAGWVDPKDLKNADTEMWLPPTEQLVGMQVWGPIQPKVKGYLLGIVTKIDGKRATVKRYSDGLEETVDVGTLRHGKLTKGLKVMAFCEDQLHPETAKVDSVVTAQGGSPKVKVICDKGNITRVDLAGSLTSQPDWLPPRKP